MTYSQAASYFPADPAPPDPSTGPRAQQRKRFYKTRLCPYHFKKGSHCKGGIHCSYAHSFQELKPSVDLTKTKLCQDYLNGVCLRRPEECPFAHGESELRPVKTAYGGAEAGWPASATGYPNEYRPSSTHHHIRARTVDLSEQKQAARPPPRKNAAPTTCWSVDTASSSQAIYHYHLGTPKGQPNSSGFPQEFTPSPFEPVSCSDCSKDDDQSFLPPRMTDEDWQPSFTDAMLGPTDEKVDPQLTLSVNQLANIILAAHTAESPNDLVSDVLGYIYK